LQAKLIRPIADGDSNGDPQLRQCQKDCLEACAKGARVIEMACGTGKTRVMKELVGNVSGKVTGTGISFIFGTGSFVVNMTFSHWSP